MDRRCADVGRAFGSAVDEEANSSRADNQAAVPSFVWSFWPQPDADCALFMAGALQLINAVCFVALMMCSDLGLFLFFFFISFSPSIQWLVVRMQPSSLQSKKNFSFFSG